MTAPQFPARRATLDDLPALRPLWEAERLDAAALEKRLTEFQLVCDEPLGLPKRAQRREVIQRRPPSWELRCRHAVPA